MAFYELITFIFQILPVVSCPYKLYKFSTSQQLFLPNNNNDIYLYYTVTTNSCRAKKRSRPNLVAFIKVLVRQSQAKNFTFWRQQFGYLVLRFKFCCCFCSLLGRKRLFLRLFLTLLSTRRSKFQKSRSPTLKRLFLTAKEAWNWRQQIKETTLYKQDVN